MDFLNLIGGFITLCMARGACLTVMAEVTAVPSIHEASDLYVQACGIRVGVAALLRQVYATGEAVRPEEAAMILASSVLWACGQLSS